MAHKIVRISCGCPICKINAEKIGASFPLKADVTEPMSKLNTHNVVHIAHDPSFAGHKLPGVTPVR
jgi:hypothetical protein